jgi:hypothetical protein
MKPYKREPDMKKVMSMAAIVCLLIIAVGCTFDSQAGGTLVIQLKDEVDRNIFETTTGLDMDIASYKIDLYSATPRGLIEPDVTYQISSDQSSLVIEALTPGDYTLRVTGHNGWDPTNSVVSGEAIAYLSGEESPFTISRGNVTVIGSDEAILVPIVGRTGNLTITVDWTAILNATTGEPDLVDNPDVSVTITQINDKFVHYSTTTWTDANSASVTTETKSDSAVADGNSVISFTDIPVGWYQVTAEVTSTDAENFDVTQLKRMGFVRVVADLNSVTAATTTGTFTITDATSFETGSLDLSLSEEMDPLTLSFTTIPDPITTASSATFTVAAAGEQSGSTLTYAWYINGDVVVNATTNSEALSFAEAGQYTVTVVVFETDSSDGAVNWGSASCEVDVSFVGLG